MARFSKLSDQDLDRLLAGKAVWGDGDVEELAAFVRTVSAFAKAPDEATEARHLSAIVNAAQASRAADTASRSEERIAGVSTRRKLVLRNPLASLTAKLVLATVVALALFSGAASAGKLPNSVQGPVADVAGNVGLSIPDGEDANDVDNGDVNNVDEGDVNNVDDKDQANVDDGAQADKDDGAVGDKDEGDVDNKDDRAVGDKDEGDQGNRDDEQQGNVEQGDQGNTDDGAQGDRDDDSTPPAPAAPQSHGNQGQGSSGNQGGGGEGDGDN